MAPPVTAGARALRACAPRPAEPRAGFTLTETVLTMAVIGILAATAAPRFLAGPSFDEKIYFDEIVASVRYAKQLAVATGCPVEIDFAGGSGLTLRQRSACTTGSFTRDVRHPADGAARFEASTPSGVSFASDVDPLRFDPLGRATDGADNVSNATLTTTDFTANVIGETGFIDVSS